LPQNFEGGQMPLHMRLRSCAGSRTRSGWKYQVVQPCPVAELFPEGGSIGVDDLVGAGAVRAGAPVKILGSARSRRRSR